MLPEHAEESLLKQLMQELEEAAAAVSVQIMGGHTEIQGGKSATGYCVRCQEK